MRLTDTSALVAGGAGILGAATVRRLAAAGARVIVADVAHERGTALAATLGTDRVRFVRTDVTDEGAVRAAVDAAQEWGPLRVAVVAHGEPTAAAPAAANGLREAGGLDVFRRTIDLHLGGTFNVLSQAAAAMTRHDPQDGGPRGVVIATASTAGAVGHPQRAASSAAKAGVVGLTETVAQDLALIGVRFLCIAPDAETPAYAALSPDAATVRFGAVPAPRPQDRPERYADLALQIVVNDSLNGAVLRISGGLCFED